jgi:hypothetical protein
MKIPVHHDHGRTRMDVVFIVVSVLIFALLALLPLLPQRSRSPARTQCAANMKLIALASLIWVNDSEQNELPFRVPFEYGGLMNPGTNEIDIRGVGRFDPALRNNAWLQFAFISKDIQDPKVLVCPADQDRWTASSWDNNPAGGLIHARYQNRAISYCIGLDATAGFKGNWLDLGGELRRVLLSERHMQYNTVESSCSAGVGPAKSIKVVPGPTNKVVNVGWKGNNPKLHINGGNIARLDGAVVMANTAALQEILASQQTDNGSLHFIYP